MRVTHQAVYLRLQARVDAGEGAQRIARSKALMPALSVLLSTMSISQARVPSAIPAVSVFGTVRMALAEGAAEWHAAAIHAAVETLSVRAH